MRFNTNLNKWKRQLADEAIDAAVVRAEAGAAPAEVGQRAKQCVDAAIETGERVGDAPAPGCPADGE